MSDYAAVHHLINHENFPLPETIQHIIEKADELTIISMLLKLFRQKKLPSDIAE